jgi:hypothetical protein
MVTTLTEATLDGVATIQWQDLEVKVEGGGEWF